MACNRWWGKPVQKHSKINCPHRGEFKNSARDTFLKLFISSFHDITQQNAFAPVNTEALKEAR